MKVLLSSDSEGIVLLTSDSSGKVLLKSNSLSSVLLNGEAPSPPILLTALLTNATTIELTYDEDLDVNSIPALGDYLFTWSNDLVDIDNNVYNEVIIGTQVWIIENLKTTKYADGSTIPNITDNTQWSNDAAGGMCYYNNDGATYKANYGALYNWHAVNNAAGLAKLTRDGLDQNYRVPTLTDFQTLKTYLANNGGKLKETGITHWTTPNAGATNESGFTAVGSGIRSNSGVFTNINIICSLWASTAGDQSNAWRVHLDYNSTTILIAGLTKEYGGSVRLIRNL